jgi:hypothetical protein
MVTVVKESKEDISRCLWHDPRRNKKERDEDVLVYPKGPG